MAYSRFSYADVYVFMSVSGYLECCGCSLGNEWDFDSTEAMIAHLAEHRKAGHEMPDDLEDDLRADDEENFPPQCADGHDWGDPFQPYPDGDLAFITRRKCKRCDWES